MKRKEVIDETDNGSEDEEVVIMNERIHTSGSHDSGSMFWGAFFIFSGILLLLNTFSILPWSIWEELLRFWPVLIIIAGVQMILGGSRIGRFFSTLITIFILGWVVLIALHEISPEFIQTLPDFFMKPIEWWEVMTS